MTGPGDANALAVARPGLPDGIRRPSPVVVAAVLLLLYAVAMAVGGMRLALPGPESDDLDVGGYAISGWHFGLVITAVALVWVALTVSATAGRSGARVALAVLGVLVVVGEVGVTLHYLGIRSSSYWWMGVAGLLHVPLLVAAVVLLFLPAARTREPRRPGSVIRGALPVPLAVLLLAYESVDVAAGTYAVTVRPRPEWADLMTIAGLALGVAGLGYLVVTTAVRLGEDRAHVARGTGRPPVPVVLAVVLLLAFAAASTAAGMYTLINPVWEDIGGIFTFAGLLVGLIGLGYLVVTAPLMLGRRWARVALAVPTVLLGVCWAYVATSNGWVGSTRIFLALLLPASAVVLLFLPASRPFFRRRAPRSA